MPDTQAYLLLGLAVTFVIMALLIGSMVIRHRNLLKDIELLEQLKDESG
jgi:heme exporter protein D